MRLEPKSRNKATEPTFGAAMSLLSDRCLLQQLGKDHGLVPLAWRQDQGQELAIPVGTEVDFGT